MRQTGLSLRELLNFQSMNTDHRALRKFFRQGGTFQDLYGVTDNAMEVKYEYAFNLLKQKDYEQALSIFHYLVSLNPYQKKYWMGLGSCQLNQGDHTNAVESYTMSSLIDPNDPTPYLFASYSYLALGQSQEAIQSLHLAVEVAKKDHAYRALEDQALELLNAVKAKAILRKEDRPATQGGSYGSASGVR